MPSESMLIPCARRQVTLSSLSKGTHRPIVQFCCIFPLLPDRLPLSLCPLPCLLSWGQTSVHPHFGAIALEPSNIVTQNPRPRRAALRAPIATAQSFESPLHRLISVPTQDCVDISPTRPLRRHPESKRSARRFFAATASRQLRPTPHRSYALPTRGRDAGNPSTARPISVLDDAA